MTVALVHDYLTQRGGAERVVLSMLKAFPDATLYTSVYEPRSTFSEFADVDVRTLPIDRLPLLRGHHRLALPLLARSFSGLRIENEVVVCSSSGWAHGVSAAGRKIVYCHSPARWLYQTSRYLEGKRAVAQVVLGSLFSRLRTWDRRAAATASHYVTNSTAVRAQIKHVYGINAEVLPPPPTLDPDGEAAIPGEILRPGFYLCVSRLLPYKNVDAVVGAFTHRLREERLVVVGQGPHEREVRRAAGPNVTLLGTVSDNELRWLYRRCAAVVAASFEDYGLTPLEGASFGRPSIVLRFGGFLDTVREDVTGLFFERPTADDIAEAVRRSQSRTWSATRILRHAKTYSEKRFIQRLQALVDASPIVSTLPQLTSGSP